MVIQAIPRNDMAVIKRSRYGEEPAWYKAANSVSSRAIFYGSHIDHCLFDLTLTAKRTLSMRTAPRGAMAFIEGRDLTRSVNGSHADICQMSAAAWDI